MITDGPESLHLKITYLCASAIDPVINDSVVNKVRAGLGDNNASISIERIPTDLGFLEFPLRSSSIPILGMIQLDFAGRVMRENPTLALNVSGARRQNENAEIADARFASIAKYLEDRWQISRDRMHLSEQEPVAARTKIAFGTTDGSGSDSQPQ